jgi:hypothetical protein
VWTTFDRFIKIEARPLKGNRGGASKNVAGIDPRYYYLTLGLLVLCTIVGLVMAFRIQREVEHDLAPSTEKDLLGPLEKAYYSGLMDEAEFRRIRESMEKRKSGEAETTPIRPVVKKTAGDPDSSSGLESTGETDPGEE